MDEPAFVNHQSHMVLSGAGLEEHHITCAQLSTRDGFGGPELFRRDPRNGNPCDMVRIIGQTAAVEAFTRIRAPVDIGGTDLRQPGQHNVTSRPCPVASLRGAARQESGGERDREQDKTKPPSHEFTLASDQADWRGPDVADEVARRRRRFSCPGSDFTRILL
jgi:hypothetical protein